MKKLIMLIILLSVVTAYTAQAYLVSDSTRGQWKYCQYSDGRVITIQSYQICPRWIK